MRDARARLPDAAPARLLAGAGRGAAAGAAGAHPPAFPVQQPERGAGADPARCAARRARAGGPGGTVPRAHVRRPQPGAPRRRNCAARALRGHRAAAPGRAAAHVLGPGPCAGGRVAAAAGAAAAAGECDLPRRRTRHRDRRRAGAHRAPRRARAYAHRKSAAQRGPQRSRRQPHGARQHPRAPDAVLRRRGEAGDASREWSLPRGDRHTVPDGGGVSTGEPRAELRVFIADDEAPARARLKQLLADVHAELATTVVGESANGLDVLEHLPASGAQVLLLDIQMPGLGGIELARHLGGLERAPAIIFVTAHDRHAVEAFELNALDYLMKPVRAERLAAALKKAQSAGPPPREQLGAREVFSVAERHRVGLVPGPEGRYLQA